MSSIIKFSTLFFKKNCIDLLISQIGEVSFGRLCRYTERPKTGQSAKKRDCGLLTLQGPSTIIPLTHRVHASLQRRQKCKSQMKSMTTRRQSFIDLTGQKHLGTHRSAQIMCTRPTQDQSKLNTNMEEGSVYSPALT